MEKLLAETCENKQTGLWHGWQALASCIPSLSGWQDNPWTDLQCPEAVHGNEPEAV